MMWSSVDFSAINALWSFLALFFLVAFCAYKISPLLPRRFETCRVYILFQDLIRYGKTKQSLKRDDWLRVFDIPKRWFWHFYAISVGWNGLLLVLYLNFIIQHQAYPLWLTGMLDILTGVPGNDSQVPQLSTVLVQLLLWVHSFRRLLECLFVSVFSDGAMHLVQYMFGLGYYIMLGLTVLCCDRMEKGLKSSTLLTQLDWRQIAGFVLFIWASLLQHQSMVLLARLRTGKSGTVETLAHRVPKGGLFELVSCPHYFAELLIYVSFSFVFRGLCLTWWLVVLYVLFNQALAGQLCHDLYISKYKSYPSHRRAFIPFVL
ncbi:polyprenal reductase isoform X1 [Archocentrus centrarchus]|uniref:polyprenal reductase isoform X1 n=1 Tax=Archocentrus centrarchus TaxID=63155 RepID=UPI0011E9E26A|nr:polyprenol reductase isoform X1 [Archocentrus centrarchus]